MVVNRTFGQDVSKLGSKNQKPVFTRPVRPADPSKLVRPRSEFRDLSSIQQDKLDEGQEVMVVMPTGSRRRVKTVGKPNAKGMIKIFFYEDKLLAYKNLEMNLPKSHRVEVLPMRVAEPAAAAAVNVATEVAAPVNLPPEVPAVPMAEVG